MRSGSRVANREKASTTERLALGMCPASRLFFRQLRTRDVESFTIFRRDATLQGWRAARVFSLVCALHFVLLLLLCAACGYHTAGHVVQVPESIQTIAIPAFKNESTTYRIEQLLTESVVREFTTRTRYQILHEASAAADATLQGTVLSTSATPLAYDTNTGRAASVLVVVSIRVTLMDRHGKVLYQNPQYLFREQYELSQDLTTFFQEDSPALRRLSRDFGRTLVSNLLEGF